MARLDPDKSFYQSQLGQVANVPTYASRRTDERGGHECDAREDARRTPSRRQATTRESVRRQPTPRQRPSSRRPRQQRSLQLPSLGLDLGLRAKLALVAVVAGVGIVGFTHMSITSAIDKRAERAILDSTAAVQGTVNAQLAQALSAALDDVNQNFEPTSTPRSEWAQGQMPYLYQIDPQYADETYSNGLLSKQGCGPFALSMAYIKLTGDTDLGPVEMAAWATENGYSTDKNGSAWDMMYSGAKKLGLKSEVLTASESALREALESGKVVVCVMGPGTFTSVGHYIALDGLDADGCAIVHDSNSYARSHQTWDLSLIVSEANNIWALSA